MSTPAATRWATGLDRGGATAAGSRYPELALALANGERPEPRLGEFREGVVMTRFFSQVVLQDAGGTLEPVGEVSSERLTVTPEA